MSSKYGYSGSGYDRSVAQNNTSTFHRMKETYWTTKQAVIKKLGKKEDEHVVASDSQLDSKLEVFKAIQISSMDLLRVIEKYQDRLCVVSQEENTMGRMLKAHSNKDKTRAGKMMAAVGKSESNSAQERLALHNPLRRLFQEVETFRYRAVSDTLLTINRMESARTEYRGALLWMKNVSEELDPDMYKQLEKFRKVQIQVKKKKMKFDKLKLDVMQKVDLLAASRCNMFSHVLATYQTTLLHFWEKTSRTMSAVAESFKGYQYYEFNMLRELTTETKKLADETSGGEKGGDSEEEFEELEDGDSLRRKAQAKKLNPDQRVTENANDYWQKAAGSQREQSQPNSQPTMNLDDLLSMNDEELGENLLKTVNFDKASTTTIHSQDQVEAEEEEEEYDPFSAISREDNSRQELFDREAQDSLINVAEGDVEAALADLRLGNGRQPGEDSDFGPFTDFSSDDTLLKDDDDEDFTGKIMEVQGRNREVQQLQKPPGGERDLLSEDLQQQEDAMADMDDMALLNEILNAPSEQDEFTTEWTNVFGGEAGAMGSPDAMPTDAMMDPTRQPSGFLPSSLLDTRGTQAMGGMGMPLGPDLSMMSMAAPDQAKGAPQGKGVKSKAQAQPKAAANPNSKMSAYFNLFADLDPLSNPDAIGKKPDDMTDCMG